MANDVKADMERMSQAEQERMDAINKQYRDDIDRIAEAGGHCFIIGVVSRWLLVVRGFSGALLAPQWFQCGFSGSL